MRKVTLCLVAILLMVACEKDNDFSFKPTDYSVVTLGSDYILTIETEGAYFQLVTEENYENIFVYDKAIIVEPEQLIKASLKLSDTLNFNWQSRVAELPGLQTDCAIYIDDLRDSSFPADNFQCSIGNNDLTDMILLELSQDFDDEVKLAINELIAALRAHRQ